ncbi:MAG: T9SS type A sorting domain-containing protein [Bacteroidales bacterium]|nr:T9SS type A sorting domain-containing protein [Bacteroidales bacterium]
MIRIYILIIVLHLFIKPGVSQNATNFSVPDCLGVNYDLYENLDAGKIVVIGWTMPCSSCILPLSTTYNVVQSYQSSQPGVVEMLLADDYANTPCNIIQVWANTNGLINTRRFSNPAIHMMDYGSNGMPKVVVIGADRKVYYIADDQVDHNKLIEGIDQAIESLTTAVPQLNPDQKVLNIYPNPVNDETIVSIRLDAPGEIALSVLNMTGQEKSILFQGMAHHKDISLNADLLGLMPGIYLLQLRFDNNTFVRKFTVAKR